MNENENGRDDLAKVIKIGVGALVVLAGSAVVAGSMWYWQRNTLPTCGSPNATPLVLKIVSADFANDVDSDEAKVIADSFKLSLDMIEKGELSAGGSVRKCAAQLNVAVGPEIQTFLSSHDPSALAALRKAGGGDRMVVPIEYELKALDGQPFVIASVPGSTRVAAIKIAVALLATKLLDVNLTDAIQVDVARTGWVAVDDAEAGRKVVPSVTFTLKNVHVRMLPRLQVSAIFRRVGEREEWGSGLGFAGGADGLPPAATTAPMAIRSNLGYTGSDQTPEELMLNSHFVDVTVDLLASYGSRKGVPIGTYPVTRELLSR